MWKTRGACSTVNTHINPAGYLRRCISSPTAGTGLRIGSQIHKCPYRFHWIMWMQKSLGIPISTGKMPLGVLGVFPKCSVCWNIYCRTCRTWRESSAETKVGSHLLMVQRVQTRPRFYKHSDYKNPLKIQVTLRPVNFQWRYPPGAKTQGWASMSI